MFFSIESAAKKLSTSKVCAIDCEKEGWCIDEDEAWLFDIGDRSFCISKNPDDEWVLDAGVDDNCRPAGIRVFAYEREALEAAAQAVCKLNSIFAVHCSLSNETLAYYLSLS